MDATNFRPTAACIWVMGPMGKHQQHDATCTRTTGNNWVRLTVAPPSLHLGHGSHGKAPTARRHMPKGTCTTGDSWARLTFVPHREDESLVALGSCQSHHNLWRLVMMHTACIWVMGPMGKHQQHDATCTRTTGNNWVRPTITPQLASGSWAPWESTNNMTPHARAQRATTGCD